MNRKIAAILLSFFMISSLTVLIIKLSPNVKGSRIIYVDDELGEGPGNPPENYTSIQDAIDAASDGDTIFVYNGTYLGNVWVDKTINLIGEGRERTLIDGEGIEGVIDIRADWVKVSGFTVINTPTGINLIDVQNCKVFNNHVSTSNNRGIVLSNSSGNNIYNNTASNNHRGIYLTDSFDNKITNNSVSDNDYGISLRNSTENNIMDNIVYSNNEIGIDIFSSDDNFIIKNNISSNYYSGIRLFRSLGSTLKNNTMINNEILISGAMVQYWNTHDIDTSNTVSGKPVQYWKNRTGGKVPAGAGQVILANCTNINVEGQELTNGKVGITLGFSSNNFVTGNDLSWNIWYGIYLYNSNSNNISGNSVSLNNTNAIFLESSNENSIIGNMVISNTNDGINLYYSKANRIISNTISSNGRFGIYLHALSDKLSDNNTIYHNEFVNNINQAMDDTNNGNQWDNGYPGGGNFWSDYDGVDLNSTPSQDVPPPDGIGDTPYIIDSDSQDNYPLIDIIVNRTFLYEDWNLISIPLIQSDTNLDSVLDPIAGSYDAVQWYNVTNPDNLWKHNHIQKPSHMNDLTEISHTMGFWIHIIEPGGVLLEYSGVKPTPNQSIPLHLGWNLVGYPSLTSHNRTNGLNNVLYGSDVDCIQWYGASTQSWHFMGPDDLFLPGRGYWVHSKIETVWDVPI